MSDKRDEATEIASKLFDPGDVLHAGLQSMIQHALRRARRAAAEAMRERCARLNETVQVRFDEERRALATAAVLIRALPLEEHDAE